VLDFLTTPIHIEGCDLLSSLAICSVPWLVIVVHRHALAELPCAGVSRRPVGSPRRSKQPQVWTTRSQNLRRPHVSVRVEREAGFARPCEQGSYAPGDRRAAQCQCRGTRRFGHPRPQCQHKWEVRRHSGLMRGWVLLLCRRVSTF
jgi:hypothetical protein